MTKTKLKKCPVCGAVMWHFANESRCLECAAWEAQDEKERARIRTLAPLSLGEATAMANALGVTYGQYSLMLSKQKRNVAIK